MLLDGIALDRDVHGLSGGERRRCSLAKLLLEPDDLLILDEPTNHLDVEAIAWLADHLRRRTSALVVVTHDRWFLDEVCETDLGGPRRRRSTSTRAGTPPSCSPRTSGCARPRPASRAGRT